ncbi:MAG: SpoIIE family protein phosphatase [Anaerovoracaceae bacterium]
MNAKIRKKVGLRPQKFNIYKDAAGGKNASGTSGSKGSPSEAGCPAVYEYGSIEPVGSRAGVEEAAGTAVFTDCGIEIRVGYAAAAAAGISGDAAVSCGLPGGSRALILSDGMGKGIKAAAGSRLVTTRLRRNLKAGMPVAAAIKEVNGYMIEQAEGAAPKKRDNSAADITADAVEVPATEDPNDGGPTSEEFATVDLTVIDRKSRRARFYKMGAATSFIMRQGRVRRIRGAALPVGIIPKLRLTHISAVLREGDLIIMVSDGITDADRNDPEACWLCRYLSETVYSEDFDIGRLSARQIASEILSEAKKRYGGREADDLTVAAALIVKAIQTEQENEE